MEVSNNSGKPQSPSPAYSAGSESSHSKKSKNGGKGFFSLSTLWIILIIGIAVLILALIAYTVTGTVKNEGGFVSNKDYQAVFVNVTGSSGGQAYFGHIKTINTQYIELQNVFYLEPGSSNNQFTLNNLSCALYNPQDTMIIKAAQVAFWENLKPNSQVTTDINKWYTDNLQCKSSTPAAGATGTTGTIPSTSTVPITKKP